KALGNCRAFTLIGLMESYDESVRRLCRLFEWSMPKFKPRHSLTPRGRVLTESESEILRSNNKHDQVLYDDCKTRFMQQPVEHLPNQGSFFGNLYERYWPFRDRKSAA